MNLLGSYNQAELSSFLVAAKLCDLRYGWFMMKNQGGTCIATKTLSIYNILYEGIYEPFREKRA